MNTTKSQQAGERTQNMTRRQKKDWYGILQSRLLNDSVAYKLIGWLESEITCELKGGKAKSVAKSVAEFVKHNESEIRALIVRPK